MRIRDTILLLGVTAGLLLAVTLVAARTDPLEPTEGPARMPAVAIDGEELQGSFADLPVPAEQRAPRALLRPVVDDGLDDAPTANAARRREGRRLEAQFLEEFLALQAEQGAGALERAVRDALASKRESPSRKIAGLRALHAAGLPSTDALLAEAVEWQLDVSDGRSKSVPRSALRLLFERAPSGEGARRALARLAFVQEAQVSTDLRHVASDALLASGRCTTPDDVVGLLRLEAKSEEFASAVEALSRDPNFEAAPSVSAALDPESSAAKAPGK